VWPETPEELVREQETLGRLHPLPWQPERRQLTVGACFVCFRARAPAAELAWAGATALGDGRLLASRVETGEARAPYQPGLLALREGPLLEVAVRALPERPDVLLVNATGRDHPRRAGLALHLGAILELPTVGVTDRPLVAAGDPPSKDRGARSPLVLRGEVVGFWLRTRRGARPLAVHAAWRTDAETAVELVLAVTGRARTPEPLRLAREAARTARAKS
jgi:deoxyribonuclease V